VARLEKCQHKCASKAERRDRAGLLGHENHIGLHCHSRDLESMQPTKRYALHYVWHDPNCRVPVVVIRSPGLVVGSSPVPVMPHLAPGCPSLRMVGRPNLSQKQTITRAAN
jgi:hypothetical protein